jgi:DNA repair photolyase
LLRGREWGRFLEVRANAAASYRASYDRERAWGRARRGGFTVFMSSATEPFPPQEARYGVSRSVLEAMCERPPDGLIVQTHSPRVADVRDLLTALARRCAVRVHVSIESDRDRLPGLPPPASPVARRLEAARALREAGLRVVVTVSPLLPIVDPEAFFRAVAAAADAVVLDHFLGGDGSPGATGARTLRTALPAAMAAVDPESITLGYRDRMADVARRFLPGRVGVGCAGFAGQFE